MTYIRSKIKELKANKTLKMHEWVRKKPWLYNHSQGHAQKALLTYGRAWTTRTMIMHQWKKDINMVLEKAGIKQGFAEMIKWYQNAMVKVMKTLTEEEAKEAEELAREWFRNAKKKGQQYAKEFAKEMWKCCGARVVVIAAWKDNDEEVMVTGQVWFLFHDFNDELGNGKCFPDLEHCQQKFTWYSRMIFDMNDDDKGSDSNDESRHMDANESLQMLVTDTQKVASNGDHQKRHRNPGQRPLIPMMIKKTTEVKDHQHVVSRFNNAGQSSLWSISICTKPQAMRRSMNAEQPYTAVSQRTSCNKTPFLQSGGPQRRSDNPLASIELRPMPMTPPAPTIGISSDDSRTSNSENTSAGSGPAQ
ncbi:hypothetical protein J3A83DRAFT_4186420 [Scleroderma citrinum]